MYRVDNQSLSLANKKKKTGMPEYSFKDNLSLT